MNETMKSILERRSCRKFRNDDVPEETLNQILQAGLYAASGKGMQGTKIIVVKNPKLRAELAEDNRIIGGWKQEGFDPFYGAPVILIVLAEKESPFGVEDGALVMGNLMLAAHSCGLASIWIHRARQEFEMEKYKEVLRELGVEGEYIGVAHCAIGYAEGQLPEAAPRTEGRIVYAR